MYSWRGMYYLQSAFFYAAALLFGGIAWSLRGRSRCVKGPESAGGARRTGNNHVTVLVNTRVQ
jgi:hypothetical protein